METVSDSTQVGWKGAVLEEVWRGMAHVTESDNIKYFTPAPAHCSYLIGHYGKHLAAYPSAASSPSTQTR